MIFFRVFFKPENTSVLILCCFFVVIQKQSTVVFFKFHESQRFWNWNTLKRCENRKRLNSSFLPIHPKKYGVGPVAHTAYLFPPGLQEGSTFNIIIIIVKTSNDQLICFNCIMSWPTFSTRKYTYSQCTFQYLKKNPEYQFWKQCFTVCIYILTYYSLHTVLISGYRVDK